MFMCVFCGKAQLNVRDQALSANNLYATRVVIKKSAKRMRTIYSDILCVFY